MTLVKLTGPSGADIFVNPTHVIAILDGDADGTESFCYVFVATVATKLRIAGTSDDVAAKLGYTGSVAK